MADPQPIFLLFLDRLSCWPVSLCFLFRQLFFLQLELLGLLGRCHVEIVDYIGDVGHWLLSAGLERGQVGGQRVASFVLLKVLQVVGTG